MVGAELEENLGIRYITSSLESNGHQVEIVPFNTDYDTQNIVKEIINYTPELIGLSMVFTSRGPEFCNLTIALREAGYRGHINAGGPFASFNYDNLLNDYPSFDSIALGEGEKILCDLADNLTNLSNVKGLCYRNMDGSISTTPAEGVGESINLPFPIRDSFYSYFDKPIASVLTSRGCWRNCAFCSINAWYEIVGGKRFRVRSVDNIG